MEDADIDFYCDTIAEDDNVIIYQILKAMCKFGIYTGIYFKPIRVRKHPEYESVTATYGSFAAIRVGYDGRMYEAVASIVMPPWLYEDFVKLGLAGARQHIDIAFSGYGSTPEEALAELKRKVEEEAPSYVDALARLITGIKQLKYITDSDSYKGKIDIVEETAEAYFFTALEILDIAKMVGANIDVKALERKVTGAYLAYFDIRAPWASEQGERPPA